MGPKKMNGRFPHIFLIRTGVTSLDLQGRLCGRLDIPLAPEGEYQIDRVAEQLASRSISLVVSAPGMASVQTARRLAMVWKSKTRAIEELVNIDFGLWHGRCIDELHSTQPRVLKCLEERPETVCPPQGEPVALAQSRVSAALERLGTKYGNRLLAVAVPGPIAAIVRAAYLGQHELDETGMGLWWESTEQRGWFEFPGNKPLAVR